MLRTPLINSFAGKKSTRSRKFREPSYRSVRRGVEKGVEDGRPQAGHPRDGRKAGVARPGVARPGVARPGVARPGVGAVSIACSHLINLRLKDLYVA
jgi:hypothetical protein